MRRRQFITFIGGVIVSPLPAWAQHAERAIRRVGVLWGLPKETPDYKTYRMAFMQVLKERGWNDDSNIKIENRWSALAPDQLRAFAAELVALKPDVLVGDSTPATAELLHQTRTIPIVFARVTDPQGQGFVESVMRPSGNATGFTNFERTMSGKWVALLKQIVPTIMRVALIYNPRTAPFAKSFLPSFESAAHSSGVEPISIQVHDTEELEDALAEQAHGSRVGFIMQPDSFLLDHRAQIIATANRFQLPIIYSSRDFAEAGGLISYGNLKIDMYKGAASYVDRILRGEKPTELPVQFPTRFEMVINLTAAKAIGLDVPSELITIADELIE